MRRGKVFIAMHYLEIGGAEAALIGLLKTLDPKRVDVDLFLYDKRGELVVELPDWVNVLPQITAYSMLERPIRELLSRGFFSLAIRRLIGKCKAHECYKRSGSELENYTEFFFAGRESVKSLSRINPSVEYDLAISFLTPHFIVLDKVCARKKIGWIHTDYTNVFVDIGEELKMWSRLDQIISISPDVTKSFCSVYPTLKDKIIEIENILSPSFIKSRANALSPDEIRAELRLKEDDFFLLTIGRFCPPKKMEEIPIICRLLRKKGLNLKWYIIGFGNETSIKDSIRNEDMQDFVIILGKRSNPYPYIAACDVYVQPSRYEGKSIVVIEAQILGKPVIVTNYPTAPSQVRDGIDGFIVPMPIDECVEAIHSIFINKQRLENVRNYNQTHDFGNESEVEKIYSLIP